MEKLGHASLKWSGWFFEHGSWFKLAAQQHSHTWYHEKTVILSILLYLHINLYSMICIETYNFRKM